MPEGFQIERRARRGRASLAFGLLAIGCAGQPGGTAGADGGGGGAGVCVGVPVVTAKRVVRLSEHQLWNAYTSLFGPDGALIITGQEDPPSALAREFPPISGEIGVSESLLGKVDRLAQAAMSYVSRNAAALTPCGARPTDKTCVQEYLLSFAERAFRHPPTGEEQRAITGPLWTEMMAAGATLSEALGYGVYAILSSPSFLYRTELGAEVATDGPLTAYELATALSLFLTDRPPDPELLAAAAADALGTPDEIRAQAARLLQTPAARANLEHALLKYFSFTRAGGAILNPEATPGLVVTAGMQASIFREGELFLRNLLWSGPLGDLLTSRQTWTNAAIATQIYGVDAPGRSDADGFGLVALPADRAGLLTLSTFLLAGARSTGSSPVARGLAVNGSVVCEVNPRFPEITNPETGRLEPDPAVTAAIAGMANDSERDKARYRAAVPACADCHLQFDPFGMVLEPYDAVGRFRTADLQGRPIDESWTTTLLPRSVGGAKVTNAAEAARALATSGALDRCLAMSFINYALTEVSRGGANNTDLARAPQTGSCAVQAVMDRFAATDRSFSSLMREIAASDSFVRRSGGR